jgi:hypothetical protein
VALSREQEVAHFAHCSKAARTLGDKIDAAYHLEVGISWCCRKTAMGEDLKIDNVIAHIPRLLKT